MNKYITTSYKKTQKLGENFAQEILALRQAQGKNNSAVVFGLSGNLGGGKTTFLQGFAKGLGIKEKILSPTFVVMKKFKIPTTNKLQPTSYFYHFDCYRFERAEDILDLGWKDIISNPINIVAVEWPDKIKKVLPKDMIKIDFKFIDKTKREIKFDSNFRKNIIGL